MKSTQMAFCLILTSMAIQSIGQSARIGADTPEELVRKVVEATENKDHKMMASLYVPKNDKERSYLVSIAEIHSLIPTAREIIKSGYEKFGDDFRYALEEATEIQLCLLYAYDFRSGLNQTLVQKRMFDQITVSVMVSQIDVYGDTTNISYGIVLQDGRWGLPIPSKSELLLKAIREYLPSVRNLIQEENDVDELGKKMRMLRSIFNDYWTNED